MQLRIMTFLAREENMWQLLSDLSQDPFAQLASMWLGTPLSQVHFEIACGALRQLMSLLTPAAPDGLADGRQQRFSLLRWCRCSRSSGTTPR